MATTIDDLPEAEHAAWRRSRQEALTGPQGDLALIETRWSAPGDEPAADDLLAAESAPGVTVTRVQRTDLDTGRPQHGIRRWDARSGALQAFAGVDAYPYDPAWVVRAAFEPGGTGTVAFEHLRDGGRTRDKAVPGVVTATVGGDQYRLAAFDDGGVLLLVFGDPTNGAETYGAGRFLLIHREADRFGTAGEVVLDFNRAYVPPCGFSDQFNCPLPPPSNRLAVPVRAGERVPRFAASWAH